MLFFMGVDLKAAYSNMYGSKSFVGAYDVSCLTMNDGLRHNYIDDIYKDSRGFIWFGYGGGGLARFDGYKFVDFNVNSARHPLHGNFATEIAEDSFGRLWVATEGGVDIIEVLTLNGASVCVDDAEAARILHQGILSVSTDASGCVWLRSRRGIYAIRLDDNGNIDATATMPIVHVPSGTPAIRDIYQDSNPWTSVSGRIVRLSADFESGKVSVVTVDSCLDRDPDIMVSDFLLDGNQVWIATDQGLVRYSPAERKAKTYFSNPADNSSLSQNYINSISQIKDGRLIVGTLQGLSVYNPMSDSFERIGLGSTNPHRAGLNNLFVNKIFVDGDRVWVGTEGGGVNRFTAKRLYSKSFPAVVDNAREGRVAPVNSILAEDDGDVWFGSIEGGLHHTDTDYSSFSHYNVASGHLGHNSVSALARDSHGWLWAGTWGGGIDVLDTSNGCRHIAHYLSTSDGRHAMGYVGALVYDPVLRYLWIGTSRGLFVATPDGEILEAYPGVAEDIFGAIGAVVDADNHLWMGTSAGLIDIDLLKYAQNPGKDAFRFIKGHLDDPTAVADERITYLYIDHEKTMWVGTNVNGLFRRIVDDRGERFEVMSSADGLPNDVIHGITEDKDGNLWIATYRGLARIDTDRKTVVSFDNSDGLDCDCFYWNAGGRDAAGNLLFGTVEGLTVITGYHPFSNTDKAPALHFTSVRIDNQELSNAEQSDSYTIGPDGRLSIHEGFRSVSFEFSSLDYDNHKGGVYSYRLKGFDPSWIVLPDGRRYVSYTNLSPGDYTMEVAYRPPGIKESELLTASVPLTITPYFYKRWWFIILTVIIAVSLAYFIYKRRVLSLKNQQKVLEETVAQRTSEIEEHKRQVQQLTMDRIAFFTNITHEFRTPITLIIGPIERALKLSYNPQVIEQLHFVERNSKYLLSLVNQLMDFRKLESGKMEISLTKADLKLFLDNLIGSFKPTTDDRNIDLKLVTHLPRPIVRFDVEAIQKVLINLLGNAVKFSPERGHISVYATILPMGCFKGSRAIFLSVSDSGKGIAPDDVERIFDRFYQGKSSMSYPVSGQAGSGIGLYLCRSLIEIYGGSISFHNNHSGRGCTFRVLLPLDSDDVPEVAVEDTSKGVVSTPAVVAAHENVESKDSSPTILVVEDNDDMRSFIRSILTDRFYVAEARNGEDALKVLFSKEIDLIISDLMMPVMDGIELSRRVKETFEISHIPFLMLTAKAARESRLESFRIGVDEYILKPFDEELLLARIDNILDNKRRYQQRFAGHLEVETLNIDEDSRDKKFMDQVMSVIKDNYRNSYFEIGDFAEALGVSRSLLNKKLQSIAGQPAGQLLRSYRLNTARELLERNRRTKAMNISEIAYEVGFNDSKYFTRCFTKHFGVTPSSILYDAVNQ